MSSSDAETDQDDGGETSVRDASGPVQSLDARVRLVWIGRAVIVALVGGVIAAVGGRFADIGLWPGGIVFVVFAGSGVIHAAIRYRTWRYQVRENSLYLERGVFTRVTTVVPFVRIQHVDANRGPIERAVGLATVVVYTAGSRGADVTIPGLTPERADTLQDRLKTLAIAAEGDDAV